MTRAGAGLSVRLVEAADLAQHTSSASTKLIHGGLRYLEYGEFRLVRESLIERERLLMAPHVIWPAAVRVAAGAIATAGVVGAAGAVRLRSSGGRRILPATSKVDLAGPVWGDGLRPLAGRAMPIRIAGWTIAGWWC